jgi:gliding motility-associated-like protein
VNGGTGLKQFSIETPPQWRNIPVFDSLTASIPYNIQAKDGNGCLAFIGIYQLTSIPGPQLLPAGNGSYCEGSTVELSASSATALVYEWKQPDANTIFADTLTITSASAIDSGLYQVIGKDLLTGCSDTAWLAVSINKLPEVSFGLPPTLCSGTEQILSPGPQYASYIWQDGSAAPTFPAVDMGTYFVLATDSAGCSGSDTLELIPCSQVFFPNAFSPDRNGKNESFRPVTGGIVLLDYKMIIYNRWGQLIYQSNDYITGWDGTFNGAAAPNGIYPYLITYRIADPVSPDLSKVSKFRGTVLLVK